jgi:hypothetical protein
MVNIQVTYFIFEHIQLFMKQSKKVIRQAVEVALNEAIVKLELPPASKKIHKLLQATAKKISDQIKSDLKKQLKKEAKVSKSVKPALKKKAA